MATGTGPQRGDPMWRRLALATSLALIAACTAAPPPPAPPAQPVEPAAPAVGGDRDAHGCIPSAGYRWCERSARCERPWELASAQGFENTAEAFEQYCRVPEGAAR
jgi:hypothetical protein